MKQLSFIRPLAAITALPLALVGCAATGEAYSSSEQALATFSSTVLSMEPVGYWRLGEASGTTVVDSSSNAIHGTYYNDVTLRIPGGVGDDRDTAAEFGPPRGDSYAEIPDHKIYSLTRAWDNFNRIGVPTDTWGPAAGGESWSAQVSSGDYYRTDGAHGIIDPDGHAGTFQQGLPTTLLQGDMQVRVNWSVRASGGPLQPVALVAQRVDNDNFVRAELWENSDGTLDLHLIKTVNGANNYLAAATNIGFFDPDDWWYIRFQFDGPNLRARAWKMGTPQPTTWQVSAVADSASVGSIAIRSANSVSSVRPVVRFEGFWAQTLGLSIHLMVNFETLAQPVSPIYLFGKGDESAGTFSDGNREYHIRYHKDTNDLKAYVFSREGGLGAGINYHGIAPSTWYSLVILLDSGDALDLEAGISMYVNGVLVGGAPDLGAKYDGNTSWQVYPLSGNAPLRFGTLEKDNSFHGSLDEIAIFSRKLTPTEVATLYDQTLDP